MIDFGKEEEVRTRSLIVELLEFIDDVVDDLGSRETINYVYQMLDNGTGADRQLKVYEETGDLVKVVDYILEETMQNL
jgi:glutamate---cysteine ligase / carboxylate-amine ligase